MDATTIEQPPEIEVSGTAVGQVAELNANELAPEIREVFTEIRDLELERGQLNAEINAKWKSLGARGLNVMALKQIHRLNCMEPDRRTHYGKTIRLADQATQMGLFEEQKGGDNKVTPMRRTSATKDA